MSPAIHNAAFDETGHDGVYLPLLVNPGYESFKAFMESFLPFEALDLSGLSVTLPHKENALRYLKEKGAEVEPLARADRRGEHDRHRPRDGGEPKLRGINTDYAAILDSITDKLGITRERPGGLPRRRDRRRRHRAHRRRGAGRTTARPSSSTTARKDRADALAAEFNGKTGKVVAAPMEKLCDSCCQVYVNTTCVGMHPNVDASPLGDAPPKFTPDTLVFDTVYNPPKTKLLQQAEAAGAKTDRRHRDVRPPGGGAVRGVDRAGRARRHDAPRRRAAPRPIIRYAPHRPCSRASCRLNPASRHQQANVLVRLPRVSDVIPWEQRPC